MELEDTATKLSIIIRYRLYEILPDNITKSNSEVVSHTSVNADFVICHSVIRQNDTDCLPSPLALE